MPPLLHTSPRSTLGRSCHVLLSSRCSGHSDNHDWLNWVATGWSGSSDGRFCWLSKETRAGNKVPPGAPRLAVLHSVPSARRTPGGEDLPDEVKVLPNVAMATRGSLKILTECCPPVISQSPQKRHWCWFLEVCWRSVGGLLGSAGGLLEVSWRSLGGLLEVS